MPDRFLTVDELYARRGRERIQRLAPPKGGGFDAGAIATAKTTAENEALSRLSARYPTQLPATPETTPEVLKDNVAAATHYHLAAAHHDQVAEDLRRGYEDVLTWYREVVAGRANLDLALAAAVDRSAPQILATKTTADLVFGNGGLDAW